MTRKTEFRKKIEIGLNALNRKQVIQFAWRCVMRALPYIGSEGHFNYWKTAKRQKYLYAIFRGIDIAHYNFNTNKHSISFPDVDIFSAARVATPSAKKAIEAYTFAVATSSADVDHAADFYASTKAAEAAFSANASARAAKYSKTIAYTEDSAKISAESMEKEILNDLKSVEFFSSFFSIGSYGEIWDIFQMALKSNDCIYWGNLYEDIFTNYIEFDEDDLERRINLPKEIQAEGAAAVSNYLLEFEKGDNKRLNEARIIILGDKGVGKTSLARKLRDLNAPMPEPIESTKGVDTTLWKISKEKESLNVYIWDFAGHAVTHAVHQFFLSERCLYIVVNDGRKEKRDRLEYWLDHMKNFGGESNAIVLVNKQDENRFEIPINRLKEKYSIYENYNFSIKEDKEDLKKFRERVIHYIQNNPSWERQRIPESYYKVKEELEQIFSPIGNKKGEEHIRKDQFDRIAEKYQINDKDRLLKDLHALGVSLWYNEIKGYDRLVLNPEWISNGVYKIVNWVSNHERHSMSIKDCRHVFKDEWVRYNEKSHKFLFQLMMHYELAYETISHGISRLIIPHLLKEDQPSDLPKFSLDDSLFLQYKAAQPLPSDTISRFIVKHHDFIKNGIVWRYGVILLDRKGSLALVKEEDRSIFVSVRGHKKEDFLSTLRETLNMIFDSYKSKKPDLQYRIRRYGEILEEPGEALWLSESKIVKHAAMNKPYFDDVTNQDLLMTETVNIYNIDADTVFTGPSQIQQWTQTQNTFNFHDCNISLQSNLNELSSLLTENGFEQEARKLNSAASLLEKVEKTKDKDEIKKKGILNRLKRIVLDLGNEDSKLHQIVAGVEYGVETAQEIGQYYNEIAQWIGMPQIPKPFLGGEDRDLSILAFYNQLGCRGQSLLGFVLFLIKILFFRGTQR